MSGLRTVSFTYATMPQPMQRALLIHSSVLSHSRMIVLSEHSGHFLVYFSTAVCSKRSDLGHPIAAGAKTLLIDTWLHPRATKIVHLFPH
eukprot:4816941-Amphidinium_carterae.1